MLELILKQNNISYLDDGLLFGQVMVMVVMIPPAIEFISHRYTNDGESYENVGKYYHDGAQGIVALPTEHVTDVMGQR